MTPFCGTGGRNNIVQSLVRALTTNPTPSLSITTSTSSPSEVRYYTTTPTAVTEERSRKDTSRNMSMKNLFITGDAPGFPRPEPAEVYQEAALSLRYKRITAITAVKLQRAMALLQLEPHVLVERGLASMSSLERNLEYGKEQGKQLNSMAAKRSNSPRVVSSCLQNDLNGIEEEEIGDNQDDQDDGWGDYEDNYDSDSDIDDDDDQDDEIEERKKGPIYAFLVYGGVQLRPDEYILLFRALGVSPQDIEQLQRSNIETDHNHDKTPPHFPNVNNGANATQPHCNVIGSKPLPPHGPSSNGRDGLGGTGRHEYSCLSLFVTPQHLPSLFSILVANI